MNGFTINPLEMKNWMVFALALVCVVSMLYAGVDALSKDQERMGLFFTFVGSMTVIGLVMDFISHIKARRPM